MIEIIIGAIIGLCFFCIPMWCYRRGLQDGIKLNNKEPIQPIKMPVTVIQDYKETKETKKKNDTFVEGFNNMMNFQPGISQKEGEE